MKDWVPSPPLHTRIHTARGWGARGWGARGWGARGADALGAPCGRARLLGSVFDRSVRLSVLGVLGALAAAELMSSPVLAQDGPAARQRVYVVSHALEPELEAVAARAGSAAREALRSVETADWQAADQRFLGYDDAALEHITTARQLSQEGSQAYLDLRLDDAEDLLQRAVTEFDTAQAAVEDESSLGRALLYLGAAQVFGGNTRRARHTFARLHRQMPHIKPDPNEFPPEVVSQYDSAAPRSSEGAMHVMSDPTGAIVYVDFVPRGLTPLTVTDLTPGEHTVRLTRPGATPYLEQVDVGRSQAEVQAFLIDAEGSEGLAEMVAGITGHELKNGDGPIRQVGELLDLDKIGVVRVSYGDSRQSVRLEMVIFDVASGRRVLRGEVQAPRALGELEPVVQQAVQQSFERVLDPNAVSNEETVLQGGGEVIRTGPEDVEQPTFWKTWWFWTAVGAVVVGGVVLTAVLASGNDNNLGQDPNGQIVIEFGGR